MAALDHEQSSEKKHLSLVVCGHVDAGKSTICGCLMKLTGMVDARTLEKYEREAKEKNRESWFVVPFHIWDVRTEEGMRFVWLHMGL